VIPVWDYALMTEPLTAAQLASVGWKDRRGASDLFSHAWGGVIDTCTRFCPFFGTAFGGRLAYAAGYTGLGVDATRFAAQVLLDLLEISDSERIRLTLVTSKPLPFRRNPSGRRLSS